MTVESSTIISIGSILVSAGVAWGITKTTNAFHAREILEMRGELAEARRLALELRTALVGINGDNGLASEVRKQRTVSEQNHTMIHEMRAQVMVLMERRSSPR